MAIPVYVSLVHTGSSGPDTALVQTWLNGLRDDCSWYSALRVDGAFGKKTENAVREFQLRSDLVSDGKVGRKTWDELYAKYAARHGTAAPYPGVAMRRGDAGAAVKLVQQTLDTKGYALTADGKYGEKTAKAVQLWQGKNGLAADGVVGAATWAKLF